VSAATNRPGRIGKLVRYCLLLSLLGFNWNVMAQSAPLDIESKIPLGRVRGRIDHLAIDLTRQRLFVAELGNDSVGVVDVKERKVVQRLTGLREPQGIGIASDTDTVYVANGKDGSVRLFRGADLNPVGQVALGDDADNVRVDAAVHRVFVGYGSGALAVIDTATRAKVADIPLKGHPESFRLEPRGSQIFVNVPGAHEISVVDRTTNRLVATWPTGLLLANYAMALDDAGHVLAVFRYPARVGVFNKVDGKRLTVFETCGDSDDVFTDAKRQRLYVICGQGYIDVFTQQSGKGYARLARVATVAGARTGLFVPEMDRLFLAVRASGAVPASVWVFHPSD
jgi:DNA-binding beta-propeller fold protein YncE